MCCAREKCLSIFIAVLDDHFGSAHADTIDHDSFMALSFATGADVSWLATDPDISDPDFDQEPTFQARSSLLEPDFESDEDF